MSELIYAPQNLWTTYHEKLLIKWRSKAIGFEWQHKRTAELYERLNYIFGFIAIIFTAITGASFIVNLNNQAQCDGDLTINIIFCILLILASISSAITTFFKYNEWSEKHKNCADRWRNYINNIDAELSFAKEERINGKIFMKQMQKRYNELIEICPNIPRYIQKKYVNNKLTELSDVIIDDSIVKYSANSSNSPKELNDNGPSTDKIDIQEELEEELRGKKIKENIDNYINFTKPLTRLTNL
jgi:hypothetical protein